jgi:hypothetical protein
VKFIKPFSSAEPYKVDAEDSSQDNHVHLSIDDALEFAAQLARMKASETRYLLTQLTSPSLNFQRLS